MTYEFSSLNLIKNLHIVILILLSMPISQMYATSIRENSLENQFGFNLNLNKNNASIYNSKFENELQKNFFQKNSENVTNNGYFYLNLKYYSFYFFNSKIVIDILNIQGKKVYSIVYKFLNANSVIPQGMISKNILQNINEFSQIIYPNIYQKTNLVFFVNQNGLKYNFIVRPGGNPNDIDIEVKSNLLIENNFDSLNFFDQKDPNIPLFSDSKLFSYQDVFNYVNSSFIEKSTNNCYGQCYGFYINGYDSGKNLIIDPYWVEYDEDITFPNLSTNIVQANGMQFDNHGDIIVYGQIDEKINKTELYVAKYSPDGELLNYTFIGGSGNDSVDINNKGKAIQIDGNGFIYITGYTDSFDFPKAINTLSGGYDVFISKLNNNLEIQESYFIGGSKNDFGISLSIYEGEIFLSGITYSLDFKLKDAVENLFNGGNNDGFIAKFDLTFNLIFSTYVGGNNDDYIIASTVDNQGNLIITGSTTSTSFNISQYAIQTNLASIDASDGFIFKISNDGKSIIFNTYFGGEGSDQGNSITIDDNDNIYIIGSSTSLNIKTQSETNEIPFNIGPLVSSRIFVIKIDKLGYNLMDFYKLGGDGNDYGLSIILDNNGNILISGNTYSSNFWAGTQIASNEYYRNSRSFLTRINNQSSTLGLSSIVQKNCPVASCIITSQNILVDKNNDVYLLGNNNFVQQNTIKSSWLPFLVKISSQNDVTPPVININQYSLENKYSAGDNLSIVVFDDLSGLFRVLYNWNNDSQQILNYPYILRIPNISGNSNLNITAIDYAGNIASKSYSIILKSSSVPNEIFLIGMLALSVVVSYITVYSFWKFYFSKRKIKSKHLEFHELQDYLNIVKKDENLLDELKIKEMRKIEKK